MVATGGIWKYDVGKLIGEHLHPTLVDRDPSMYLADNFTSLCESLHDPFGQWLEKLQSSSIELEKKYSHSFPQFDWCRPTIDILESEGQQVLHVVIESLLLNS